MELLMDPRVFKTLSEMTPDDRARLPHILRDFGMIANGLKRGEVHRLLDALLPLPAATLQQLLTQVEALITDGAVSRPPLSGVPATAGTTPRGAVGE
jgi:hypothetical protein